jgi:hypothetical protein
MAITNKTTKKPGISWPWEWNDDDDKGDEPVDWTRILPRHDGSAPKPNVKAVPTGQPKTSGGGSSSGGSNTSSGGGSSSGGSRVSSTPVKSYHESRVQVPSGNGGGYGGPLQTGAKVTIPSKPGVLPTVPGTPPGGTPVTGPGVTDPPPAVPPSTSVVSGPGYEVPSDPRFIDLGDYTGMPFTGGVPMTPDVPNWQRYLSDPTMPGMTAYSGAGEASPSVPWSASSAVPNAAPMSAFGAASGAAPAQSAGIPGLNSGNIAGNYPEISADTFASDPNLLVRDMLNQMYGNGNANGLYDAMSPYAKNMNALYFSQTGQDASQGNKAAFMNWAGQQIGNQMRPGAYTNVQSGINNVLNPMNGSPIQSYLSTGSYEDQVNNTNGLLGANLVQGYHPMFAQAAMNQAKDAGLDYQAMAARGGNVEPFYKYLQSSASGIPQLARLMGS